MNRFIGVGGLKIGKLEKKYLKQVIDSNRLSYGPITQQFENEFARQHNCDYGVFSNSGTSALQIALQALKEKYKWKDGDEVIVPAVTFVATPNIVFHNRMTPVFVDVCPYTYNINHCKIEEKITKQTRAIIPVHLMGLPADMLQIMKIAERYRLKVIEDSCETMFANYMGQRVGSLGNIGCFSTYVAHYIVTGIGGICTTNDPDLAIRMRSLMNHGRDSIYLNIDQKGKEVINRRFKFVSRGHSFRATEMEAALGLGQLERAQDIVKLRQRNALRLTKGLEDLQQLQLPDKPNDRDHVFMLYPLVLEKKRKDNLVRKLEEVGIETRDLMPLINQPIYKNMFPNPEKYPVALWLERGGFYIGCHQYITPKEIDYMIEQFHRILK